MPSACRSPARTCAERDRRDSRTMRKRSQYSVKSTCYLVSDPPLDRPRAPSAAPVPPTGRRAAPLNRSRTRPMRVFNFSAGPAVLPEAVLEKAAAEMLDWRGTGMSVMEMSHRGKEFIGIAAKAEADLRKLLRIAADYKVLFLQGGAIAENAIIPMNLLADRKVA